MEYLDVCDATGRLSGETVLKTQAHEKGIWHRSAHVWVANPKKGILFQQRSLTIDNHPGKWDISAAGHVSAGESYLQAAKRETREELGLVLADNDFCFLGEVKQESSRPGYINREVNPVYLVWLDIDVDKIVRQEEEVAAVKFLPFADFCLLVSEGNPSFVPHPEEYALVLKYLSESKVAFDN